MHPLGVDAGADHRREIVVNLHIPTCDDPFDVHAAVASSDELLLLRATTRAELVALRGKQVSARSGLNGGDGLGLVIEHEDRHLHGTHFSRTNCAFPPVDRFFVFFLSL
jgi:hypothetical protein